MYFDVSCFRVAATETIWEFQRGSSSVKVQGDIAQVLKRVVGVIFVQMNMGSHFFSSFYSVFLVLFDRVPVFIQQRLTGSQSQAKTGRDATYSNYYYEEEVSDACAVALPASLHLKLTQTPHLTRPKTSRQL